MAIPTTPAAVAAFMASMGEYLADPVVRKAADDAMWYGQGQFMAMLTEPHHQFVRYDACANRVVYERADSFYIGDCSPSSSRWMVPGS
jgi:limonene-1,2-epoxide hydrolase